MGDKIPFGFWCKVFGLLNIFYIGPLVMPIPAIEAQHGIAIRVHSTVQKNWPLTFLALTVDLQIIS